MTEISLIFITTFISSLFAMSIYSDNKQNGNSFLDNKNFIPGLIISFNGMQLVLYFQELTGINSIICIIACSFATARILEIITSKKNV